MCLDIDSLASDEVVKVKQAIICMIDICGFSKWCMHRMPSQIVQAMNGYNDFINNLSNPYEITKVELVGDCCLLLSEELDAVLEFAVSFLQQLNEVRKIFNDKCIGVRIAIHTADVFGIMLNNPRRFQLYSNDINVCARLESNAIPNTIHISLKTALLNDNILKDYTEYVPSPRREQEYKGVGLVSSYTLHIVRDREILWFDTTMCSIKGPMSDIPSFSHTYVIHDLPKLVQKMYSFFWTAIVIHCPEITPEVKKEIIAFREWERDRKPQMIVLISPTTDEWLHDMCVFVKSFQDLKRIFCNVQVSREPRRSTF
jgi:hypothetical protein